MLKDIFQKPQNQIIIKLQEFIRAIQTQHPEIQANLNDLCVYRQQITTLISNGKYWKQLEKIVLAVFDKANGIYQAYLQSLRDQNIIQQKKQIPIYWNQIFRIAKTFKKESANNSDHDHLHQKFHFLLQQLKVYPGIQAQLLIQRQYSDFIADKQNHHKIRIQFQRLYPLTLRVNAIILQQYINLRKDKVSSDKDRPQNELILQKYCQRWIEGSLIYFYNSLQKNYLKIELSTNKEQRKDARRYFINFASDVIEALLQNIEENMLNKNILINLLQKITSIVIDNYDAQQLLDYYIRNLRSQKSMKHPIKVLQVVQIYENTSLLNCTGICYLLFRLIKNSYRGNSINNNGVITTFGFMMRTFIPAISQSLRRSFPYKYDFLDLFYDYLKQNKSNLVIVSDNQYDYPISNLLVSLLEQNHQKQNQKLIFIVKYFTNYSNLNSLYKIWLKMLISFRPAPASVELYIVQKLLERQKESICNNTLKQIFTNLSFRQKQQKINEGIIQILSYLRVKQFKWVKNVISQKIKIMTEQNNKTFQSIISRLKKINQ